MAVRGGAGTRTLAFPSGGTESVPNSLVDCPAMQAPGLGLCPCRSHRPGRDCRRGPVSPAAVVMPAVCPAAGEFRRVDARTALPDPRRAGDGRDTGLTATELSAPSQATTITTAARAKRARSCATCATREGSGPDAGDDVCRDEQRDRDEDRDEGVHHAFRSRAVNGAGRPTATTGMAHSASTGTTRSASSSPRSASRTSRGSRGYPLAD